MRIRASLGVLCIAGVMVGALACGGDDGSNVISIPSGVALEESLRYTVPTPDEFSRLLEGWGNPPATVGTDYSRSNADLASELPGYLSFTSHDEEAIAASGRKTGYLAVYTAGTTGGFSCCTAEMAIDLYGSKAEAQRLLESIPVYAKGGLYPDDIGDSGVAWLGPEFGVEPACPCELWFRVGPLMGAVVTSYHGPAPTSQGPHLDPVQKELALLIVQRMRAVLESASPK